MIRIIGGTFKNRQLKATPSSQTRPTLAITRKAVFDILQDEVIDALFLDLFAGTGAIGIEALSRGAQHVTFVDQNPQAASCIRENLAHFQLSTQATVLQKEVKRALKQLLSPFDIVYIDPPYGQVKTETILSQLDELKLLKENALIFIEEGTSDLPLPPRFQRISTRHFSQSFLHEIRYRP